MMPLGSREAQVAAVFGLATWLFTGAAWAVPDSVARGKEFARANCMRCHSIEKTGESPVKAAPPFRTLHLRYPVEYLEESLAEGMVTGHSDMPEFRLEPDQIQDFLDFLKTFEE